MISTTHNGIEIVYDEVNSLWVFTLRNREYGISTLKLAKEKIDRPVREAKEQDFEPVNGWQMSWSCNDAVEGRVTSIAQNRYGSARVRFVRKGASAATTEDMSSFFPDNEHNRPLIDAVLKLSAQIETLTVLRSTTRGKLKPLKV